MNSRRLSKLRHDGHITDSEYKELKLAIKALEAYGKILPLLNPEIDAELALEKIREVMYD